MSTRQPGGTSKGRLVAFDTQLIIWGVENSASSDREGMIPRAQALIEQLTQDECQLVLSVISVEEFLRGYDERWMESVCNVLQERFRVAPYDMGAAMRSAAIFRNRTVRAIMTRMEGEGKDKREIYDDIKIVATALNEKVEVLYSEDAGVIELGKAAGLRTERIPPCQGKLFNK